MNIHHPASLAVRASACPHDCPSTCALEVEVHDGARIGRVRGADENAYTAGVICAKVARYADRIHHPDRLTKPLRRKGAKGEGAFEPIGWDDALDIVAEQFLKAEARYGSRDGVAVFLCRHHGPGDARRHQPAAPRQEIFRLPDHHLRQPGLDRLHRRHRKARRRRSARDGEVRSGGDLGHQRGVHPGQCDDACDARAKRTRRQDRRHRHLHERHHGAGRSAGADQARHRRRAGLRDHALPVPRRRRRLGLSRALQRRAARARSACEDRAAAMGVRDHRLSGRDDRGIRAAGEREQAVVLPSRLRLFAFAQRRGQHACGELHSGGDRRLAI